MVMTAPHDAPSAAELIESVREWLEREVITSTEGRLRFHARVAANVLAIVERELHHGEEQAVRHANRLALLDVVDDSELAANIRSGMLDHRLDEVREVVRASVLDKLAVANPGYLVEPAMPDR
jgi:DNA-directed RNA polymerase subunit F